MLCLLQVNEGFRLSMQYLLQTVYSVKVPKNETFGKLQHAYFIYALLYFSNNNFKNQ